MTMTIEQSLDYIRDRVAALFPTYRAEVCRIRGVPLSELPFINVLLSDENEDDDPVETVSFVVDIMLAGSPSAGAPAAIDRALYLSAIADVRKVKNLLRSSHFKAGDLFIDGAWVPNPNGRLGVPGKVGVTYDADPRPEMIVMHATITFDIAGFVEYVDDEPDGGYVDFEAINASIDTDGPAVDAVWTLEQETP